MIIKQLLYDYTIYNLPNFGLLDTLVDTGAERKEAPAPPMKGAWNPRTMGDVVCNRLDMEGRKGDVDVRWSGEDLMILCGGDAADDVSKLDDDVNKLDDDVSRLLDKLLWSGDREGDIRDGGLFIL